MRFRITQQAEVEFVPVGQVKIPRSFTAHLTEHDDGAPDVDLVFEVRNDAPECREVHITATDDGHEVRCSGLAGIRVQDVLERTLKYLFRGPELPGDTAAGTYFMGFNDVGFGPLFPDQETQRGVVREARTARSARKVKLTDAVLQEVAEVYRANVAAQPTAAVADHFGKAHRTGALYVKHAREGGFLGAAIKGKAGEQ